MQNVDFIFKDDLDRLNQSDIKKIENYLPSLKKEKNKKLWLYENREQWRRNWNVTSVVFQKIYAGQCSIRVFKPLDILKQDIISILESQDFSFNQKNLKKDGIFSILCTFKLPNGDYVIRIRCSRGIKEKVESAFEDVVYATVVFNTEYNVFQIRSDSQTAHKIKDFLQENLGNINLKQINILDKYKTIEEFATTIKGTFQQVKANPSLIVKEVSDNDWQSFLKLIESINQFMKSHETGALVSVLENINFETDLDFGQLILVGCREIGLTSENIDLSRQGIFSMIGENIIEHKGAIQVQADGNSETFIIHVSADGGIQFKTSVDEKMINYIFSYVLGKNEMLKEMNNPNEVRRLRKAVESYISSKSIKGIRARHLLQKYKLDENLLKQELDSYISEGKLLVRYEMKCCHEGNLLCSENLEDLMLNAKMLPCPSCSSIFVDTEDVEQFIEQNADKIDVIYCIIQDDNLTGDEINYFDSLEDNLNSNCENDNLSNSKFKEFLKIFIRK